MLSPNLLPLLRRYWKLYQLQSWLLPGSRGPEPITRMGVAHICRQAGHAAKLTKTIYPHLLRHYAATFFMPSRGVCYNRKTRIFNKLCCELTDVYAA
jgi:integrase